MSSPLQMLVDALDARPLRDDRCDQRLVVADRFAPEDRPWLTMPRAVEVRHVRPVPLFDPPPVPPIAHTWNKAIAAMPDDQALHCAVLAYASDTTLLDIAFYPHGV